MTFWFSADYHFQHKNILAYCKRPFKDIQHMDSEIIKRHNERVKPKDTVFFLGDFALKDGDDILPLLNGNFIFIKGNHDGRNGIHTIIHSCIIHHGGKLIYLVHDPKDAEDFVDINFCGHVHEKWKFSKTKKGTPIVNVGVDQHNFYPLNINEILEEMRNEKIQSSNKSKTV